jgi:CheY-like chemotaxis protein
MIDLEDNFDALSKSMGSWELHIDVMWDDFSPLELNLSVLVVDDHPAHRQCAQAIFEALGCVVTLTENGAAALEACARRHFDVVLMDRHMPGGDGDEAVRRLRWRERSAQRAFIACCSSDPPGDLSPGYDVLVPKPLTVAAAADLLRCAVAQAISAPPAGAPRS